MGKSKGKSKSPKKKGKKTKRDPYPTLEDRGLQTVTENRNQKEREEALKKFGPCNFDANECYTAILMLQSEEDSIVIGALHCLQKFLKKQLENGEIFEQLRGISALSRHLHSTNRVIQRLSLKCLSLAARVHLCKLSIRNMELVRDLVELAKSEDEVVQEYAMSIISNLAALYTGRIQLIQHDIVPIATDLMRHPDSDVLRNSLETIWRLLVDPLNTELFLNEAVMASVIQLTASDYPTVQAIALSILNKLCHSVQGAILADSLGSLKRLVEIIATPEMADLHRTALKVLINMAEVPSCCKKMIPFIGPVIALVSQTSDEKTLILALNLIEKMSRVSDAAKILSESDFITKLLELLDCDKMQIVTAAVSTAAAITNSDDAKTKELLLKGIESLIDCLEGNELNLEGFEKCISTLGKLLISGKEACHLFLEWGGREMLLKILKHPENYSEDSVLSAISCIHHLGCQWNIKTFIADEEITVGVLNVAFNSHNPQILVAAAAALSTILCEPNVLTYFFGNNGYEFIVKLIQHNEEPVKIGVLPLLSILVSIPEGLEYLNSNGVLEEMWKKKKEIGRYGIFHPYFKKLLNSNLSKKFAFTGHIDALESLPDGFYEFGAVVKPEDLQRLEDLEETEENREKKIIYVDLSPNVPTAISDKNVNPFLLPIFEAASISGGSIQLLIDKIHENVSGEAVASERELVVHIASTVSDHFGGPFKKQWGIGVEMEELEIAMLQTEYKSTIVPLSLLKVGAHRPRAILFKVLAQTLGIQCTLERGEGGKFWNVLFGTDNNEDQVRCVCRQNHGNNSSASSDRDGPKNDCEYRNNSRYAVDLIYEPGRLLPLNSDEWRSYCN